MSETITLDRPLDMHLHLRDGEMLKNVAPLSAAAFAGAVVMPNLIPPVADLESLLSYRERIKNAVKEDIFEPYMTLFFSTDITPEMLTAMRSELSAVKLYPAGITTNSEGVIEGFDIQKLRPVLETMAELGIPLCVHGETGGFVMDREEKFLPVYERLADAFPALTIIMEHISSAKSAELLERYPNLYATITLHHLSITLDDLAGGMLRPHLFCKPIVKRPEDREVLRRLAMEGNPKVMFGSDSAPHLRSAKESAEGAAGIFTAPFALQALAELFDEYGCIEALQRFVSDNARKIYGITPPPKKVVLERREWEVPAEYGGVVPMLAGKTLKWDIKETHG